MARPRATALRFGAVLLVLGILYFAVVRTMDRPRLAGLAGEPALLVHHTSGRLPLDPEAPEWATMEPVKIHLYPQTAQAPFGTEERDLWVSAAATDEAIAFRLEFADATANRDSTAYVDACAVMVAPGSAPAVGQMMGHGASANIWQWRADWDAAHAREGGDSARAVHELLVSGPGTQSLMPEQTVVGAGQYGDGRWLVVLRRSLQPQHQGEVPLGPDERIAVAFATWDGAKQESLSRKSISMLRPLRPDPTARR